MHANSALVFEKYARQIFQPGMKVLEIGPNAVPSAFQTMVGIPTIQWDTVDLGSAPGITYVAKDEYSFPVPDGAYDVVLSANVLEHVRKIWKWMPELARVTRPGGRVVTVVPVSYPYHAVPVDCWRVYPEGLRALHEDAGLVTELAKSEALEVDPSKFAIPAFFLLPDMSVLDGLRGGAAKLRNRLLGRPVLIPSVEYQGDGLRARVKALMGFPATCAVDTIAIARKPGAA